MSLLNSLCSFSSTLISPMSRLSRKCHRRMVPSSEAEAAHWPEGDQAPIVQVALWPGRARVRACPLTADQNCTLVSSLLVISVAVSGAQQTKLLRF